MHTHICSAIICNARKYYNFTIYIHIIIIRTCSLSSDICTWYWVISLHCGCGLDGRWGMRVLASRYTQDY